MAPPESARFETLQLHAGYAYLRGDGHKANSSHSQEPDPTTNSRAVPSLCHNCQSLETTMLANLRN